MAQVFDTTSVFTRVQSDGRYVLKPQLPDHPSNLTMVDTGLAVYSGQQLAYIDISFTDPATPAWADENLFVINYSVQIVGLGITTVLLSTAIDTIRLNELIPGVTYQISVATVDYLNDTGAYCTPISVRAALNTTPPAAPTFTVTASGNGALITLSALNTEPDFEYYQLFRDTTSTLKSESGLLPCATFASISMTDVGVPTYGNYYYYIKAFNYSGNFSSSTVVGPVLLSASVLTTPTEISMVGVVAVANSNGTITINFPSDTDNSITSFHVQRKTLGDSTFEVIATLSPNPNLTYIDTTTVSGITYFYALTAINPSGESPIDSVNAVRVTAGLTNPPAPIVGSTIVYSGGVGVINVGWTAPSDPNVNTYLVKWRYQQVGQYNVFTFGEETSSPSYQIFNLQDPNTGAPPTREALSNLFEVEIASVDSANNQSSFVTRTLSGIRSPVQYPELSGYVPASGSLPAAPIYNSSTLNADGSITINWTPNSSTQVGYIIEQLKTNQTAWQQIHTINDATTGSKTYNVLGLEPYKFNNNQYRFRIRAFDAFSNVSPTNIVENPQFFNGFTNWTYFAEPTLTVGYTGQTNAPIVSNGTGLTTTIGIVGGLNYTFSGYFKEFGGSSGSAYISIQWFDSSNNSIGSGIGVNNQVLTTINWQRFVASLVAPANATKVSINPSASVGNALVIWDQIQAEQSKVVNAFGDGKSPWLSAVDTIGPSLYNPNLIVTPGLALFTLTWNNPTTSDYANGVFEIWRQRTASSAAGFTADPQLVKIVEVPANDDGASNQYIDTSYDPLNHTTSIYALRGRDKFGNGAATISGTLVYLATSTPETTLNVNDKTITTTTTVTQNIGGAGVPTISLDSQVVDGSVYKKLASGVAIARFKIESFGGACTSVANTSYGLSINGTKTYTGGNGYNVAVFNRATMTETSFNTYNPSSNTADATSMANLLNGLTNTSIVMIWTVNDPQTNRLLGGLPAAMERCGASKSFESSFFNFQSAYALVGYPGMGQGNGLELYQGVIASDPNAYVNGSFLVIDGDILNAGGSLTTAVNGESIPVGVGTPGTINTNIATINTQVATVNTQVATINTTLATVYVQGSATINIGNKFTITVS